MQLLSAYIAGSGIIMQLHIFICKSEPGHLRTYFMPKLSFTGSIHVQTTPRILSFSRYLVCLLLFS